MGAQLAIACAPNSCCCKPAVQQGSSPRCVDARRPDRTKAVDDPGKIAKNVIPRDRQWDKRVQERAADGDAADDNAEAIAAATAAIIDSITPATNSTQQSRMSAMLRARQAGAAGPTTSTDTNDEVISNPGAAVERQASRDVNAKTGVAAVEEKKLRSSYALMAEVIPERRPSIFDKLFDNTPLNRGKKKLTTANLKLAINSGIKRKFSLTGEMPIDIANKKKNADSDEEDAATASAPPAPKNRRPSLIEGLKEVVGRGSLLGKSKAHQLSMDDVLGDTTTQKMSKALAKKHGSTPDGEQLLSPKSPKSPTSPTTPPEKSGLQRKGKKKKTLQ